MNTDQYDILKEECQAEQYQNEIAADFKGARLDQVVAQLYPEYSRAKLQSWIRSGVLTVDGRTVKPKLRVNGGEQICLRIPSEVVITETVAEPIPLSIVYEDDEVLVVNKPKGLVVHPAPGHASGTLVNALLHHEPSLAAVPRAGVVHRIDKDTTGLLLVAKTLTSHTSLVRQLQARSLYREYQALVVGQMIAGGTVDAPIGRHPHQRVKMAVVTHGKIAVTHYRVAERFDALTLLTVRLETGRTHQIRVHMAHIGYPIVGDPVYGRLGWLPKGAKEDVMEALQCFRHQALHAAVLGFEHPRTEEWITFQASLPEDYQKLLNCLRSMHGAH